MSWLNRWCKSLVAGCLTVGGLAGVAAVGAGSASAATPVTLDLQVLLVGDGSSDPTTAAWASALSEQGVAYTEVDAAGAYGAETVTLPTLSSGTTGYYNGVVIADSPAAFTAGQLTSLFSYEATFGVNQVDGYTAPYLGETLVTNGSGSLDGITAQLTPAGLAAMPALTGPIPFATGTATAPATNGYSATVNPGAPFTPWVDCPTTSAPANCPTADVLAGVYQHPSTDAQANVSELELNFDYNATEIQWMVMAPSLINWVTSDTHLGLQRNYVEMDIDDTFTPDNAWSTAVHDNDYSDADSQRMSQVGNDVANSAEWSNPTQENDPSARPATEPATPFRLDQLFNYGGTVEYQNGELDLPGSPGTTGEPATGPDPLLAEFQATDPNTGQPYANDFGWISHTYDTPYLDVGCATQDYIEAELNENTTDVEAAPDAALPGAAVSGVAGTGGLGIPSQTIASGSVDVSNPYGTYNPDVFVPGNHSGFADLVPGTPATVDPPDLDAATPSTTGGTLAAGTYEYAVTDQFNGADSTSTDESQAYVTDGEQGDVTPVVVSGSTGSVSIVWQAICHAANYIIYRAPVSSTGVVGSWSQIGTFAAPRSATLPDAANSAADTTPPNTATVCVGPSADSTSCGGEQELTFNDTGANSGPDTAAMGGSQADSAYATNTDVAMPDGWTPPVVENANELPWEQNPYFIPALEAAGITTVGADASKPYPNPPTDAFGLGNTYTGATYAAGQPFVDGTAEVAPRHPINVFYNAATNAQELDEYNTLYDADAPDSQCHDTSVTTCSTTPFTFAEVVNQVVSGMMQNLLSNNPEISYVHQTNIMGTPPYSSVLPAATYVPAATAQAGSDGDGTLYEVLNPLISEYDSYFNATTPYVQLTMGGIGNTLADQSAWSSVLTAANPTVTASETNGVVTIANTDTSSVNVPVTVPPGTTVSGTTALQSYGGEQSNWFPIAGGSSQTLTEHIAPAITSAASATSIVGAPFSFAVSTTGEPDATLNESGALPTGITFTDNANGTATISGTPANGTGASYPFTITATNGTSPAATQSFDLTNASAPSITSAATASFSTGVAGIYTVTTTGYPAPALTESATLPSGLTFVDNGNGTGTLAGAPAAGTVGSYPVAIVATNASGSAATLDLVVTVNEAAAPAITSTSTADFTLDVAGSVATTATGSPVPAISEIGALPAGLSFTDNGNGTALVSGTPTATGTMAITITAANGVNPSATQAFEIVVGQAPTITSASSAAFAEGNAGSFSVTTTGYPAPAMGETGTLPSGVTFTDNGNGTAALAGMPAEGTVGNYPITITAINGTASTTQGFTLVIDEAPAILSASSTTFTVGNAGTFAVTTAGSPTSSLNESGALPPGVSFSDNGNGTATLVGTPASETGGSYAVTMTAANGVNPDATQSFTLVVDQAPAITSGSSATFTAGSAGSFSITTTGYPAPAITESGSLPDGLSFSSGSGGATISGTPSAGENVSLTIAASDGTGTVTQSLSVTVDQAPEFTSPSSATASVGVPFHFVVTTSGYPAPELAESGALPSGLTFTNDGNGTATVSGTPAAKTLGAYALSIEAASSSGTATLMVTLDVVAGPVPVITTAASASATVGIPFTFPFGATGTPSPSFALAGALPGGMSFAGGAHSPDLSGTPVSAGTWRLTLTAKNSAGSSTQTFTFTTARALYEVAFQATTGALWTAGSAGTHNWGLGMKAGTSPSISALPTGGYEVAFEANTGALWTAGSAGTHNWGLGMKAGTSPSISALPTGGYEVAFEANTGALWTAGSAGTHNWGLGMKAGTSPSISALPTGGYEVAFEANTGALWTAGSAGTHNWGLGMKAGTSPSISALPTGGYEVAFEANTGALWTAGSAGTHNWGLGMKAGTSPSISALPTGGYEVAFEANTGALWTAGSAGTHNWGLGMKAGTSPSISALPTGGYEVAFEANTGALWTAGSAGTHNWGLGMKAGTSPDVAA